ncbi:MAG: transcriptional repressor LexA [Anaerolineae bacterium]|jgi:repressor LexA|nr:transcriptional repressor LexA [Anaerolineae bacterium]
MALSKRQQNILGFIGRFARANGFPPTIREIGLEVGISSTSVVNYNLNVLEKKGLIERDPRVSRGLRLKESAGQRARPGRNVVQIPLVGRVAAGQPLQIPDGAADFSLFGDETVEIASGMLRDTEGVYALQVSGLSMIDALINDGDIVVMRHQNHAQNGDMVAALLRDRNETTLKRFYLEGDRVRLQPANPAMEPIFIPARDVDIQGKVIMVIRHLN